MLWVVGPDIMYVYHTSVERRTHLGCEKHVLRRHVWPAPLMMYFAKDIHNCFEAAVIPTAGWCHNAALGKLIPSINIEGRHILAPRHGKT